MLRKAILFGLTVLAIQMTSCEYHVENEDLQGNLCNPVVSYGADIRPLIDNNCMPCHNGDGSSPQAPNLLTYESVEGVSSIIREVTQTRRMPLNGMITDAEIESIRCWVDNGALNN
ncbi:MAG: c-type cytochrome [Aurantibacter sp.]